MAREPYEHVAQTLTVFLRLNNFWQQDPKFCDTRHYALLMFRIYALSVRLKARISGHPPHKITHY